MVFFIMTGLAIIVYLNQYPNQPRERDYAYVGSFDAFAIWIGIGLMFVYEKLQKFLGNKISLAVTFVVLIAAVPVSYGFSELGWTITDQDGTLQGILELII